MATYFIEVSENATADDFTRFHQHLPAFDESEELIAETIFGDEVRIRATKTG